MMPHVIMHNAVSLDGRLDHLDVDLGLYYGLAARFGADAVLSGSETLLNAPDEIPPDDGGEPAPAEAGEADLPLLVVVDGRGRINNWHYWRRQDYWRSAVVFATGGPRGTIWTTCGPKRSIISWPAKTKWTSAQRSKS